MFNNTSTRYVVLLATLVAALVAASSALAGNGSGGAPAPDAKALPPLGEPQTALVSGPTRIAPSTVPGGGIGSVTVEVPVVKAAGVTTAASPCYTCIVSCWTATTRNGPSDWSGHVYIYQYLYWCGNGITVTYATASQRYEQAGWYTLSNTYGPWWSGGGIGSATLGVSGYILWNWKTPLVNVSHSGTTSLDTTLWGYGGVTF